MRRPYAGDPETLDVEEFMQAAGNHEDSLNSATNLGLMEDSGEQKMLFMGLPSVPFESTTDNCETKPNIKRAGEKTVDLKALPEGFMGKLLVNKSGAVKMKLGEVLYDPPDYESPFFRGCTEDEAQYVWTKNPLRMEIGNVNSKHLVLTLKVKSVLDPCEDETDDMQDDGKSIGPDSVHDDQPSDSDSEDVWSTKITEMEAREKKAVGEKEEKIQGLEEELGKLMAQMDGESEIEVSETKVVLPILTNTSSSGLDQEDSNSILEPNLS